MKKHGITILCGILVFTALLLMGCGTSKPEEAVQSELDLIQQLDENTIRTFISYEDMMNSKTNGSSIGTETTEAVQSFFEHFSYKILSSTATTKTATVRVELTNLDAKAIARDLCIELIRQSIAPDSSNSPLHSLNSYFALLGDILSENEYDLVSTEADFELVSNDGNWSIQNIDALEDKLVGGFITYLNDPYLVSPEETLTLVFEMFEKNNAEDWLSYLSMDDIFSTYSTISKDVDCALANQIAACFDYSIKEVNQDGDTASASVSIVSLNMEQVLDDYLEKLMDYASTTDAVRASDTQLADKTAELLIETLDANTATISTAIVIKFNNNGSTWEMQLESEFTDALLGQMNAAVEAFQSKASAS